MNKLSQQASTKILHKLLLPLAAFCLRHSIGLPELIERFKAALLLHAQRELKCQGRQVNTSSLIAMTGIHRKEVDRLRAAGPVPKSEGGTVAKIIGQWRHSQRFTTPSGEPRVLNAEGKKSEFSELAKSVSKNLNPYSLLRELERRGYIERDKQAVRLLAQSHLPRGEAEAVFDIASRDCADLIRSVEDNVLSLDSIPHLHLRTEYDNIAPEHAECIKEWLLDEGSAFHARVSKYLAQFDRDVTPSGAKGRGIRVSIGAFSFIDSEENRSADNTSEDEHAEGGEK